MDTDKAIDKNQRHYCGPPGLTVGDLLRKPASCWTGIQDPHQHVYYTHKGRCGIGLLCRHWNLRSGDEALVPAYNCGSEIDPFVQYSLRVIFYRVDLHARIDYADILKRITSRTKVIYVTHYFGWPQEIRELRDFCRQNHIYLVEDCALSLFSRPVEHPIGILGDASIYNFPKALPVPDGGAVVMSGEIQPDEAPSRYPARKLVFKNMLPLIKRNALRWSDRAGLYRFLPYRLIQSRGSGDSTTSKTMAGLPEMPRSYYFDKNIIHCTCSRITRHILRHTCLDEVVRRRRSNYAFLYDSLGETKKFKPLYQDLPDGVCPLHFPVMADDRDAAINELAKMGISAIPWWAGYHRFFDWRDFEEARYLKDHLMAIPVHQQLKQKDIQYISAVLHK